MTIKQTTIERAVFCEGKGVHSGEVCRLRFRPAEANEGYLFVRVDIGAPTGLLPAKHDKVGQTLLGTNLTNDHGVEVATVEHVLSALAGLGIDNAIIEVDAPEVPIMDGSSSAFVDLVDEAGIIELDEPRRYIRVLKPIELAVDDKFARFEPAEETLLSLEIDFPSAAIGHETISLALTPEKYRQEIGSARTFGFLHEAEQLRAAGRARGAGLDNTIVVDGDSVLNEEPLRFEDEFVRHKLLDAIGDFALAGGPILGHFVGRKTGHAMNSQLLHALFAEPDAYEWVHKPA